MNHTAMPATMAPSELAFVYLMRDLDHSRFKIGRSIDPLNRRKKFRTKIDVGSSMQISCSPVDVARVENLLHNWFADFRIDRELIDDDDGRTEWFYFSCWDKVMSYLIEHHEYLRCSVPAPLDACLTVQKARQQAKRTNKSRPNPTRRTLKLELGGVVSMADLMSKAQAALNRSIIGEPITLCSGDTSDSDEQQYAFGRQLWEAGQLDRRKIIKLGSVDLFALSFTFTRLNEEPFDTQSLYAIKSFDSRAARRNGRRATGTGPSPT